jgi:hypothetical protein
MLARPTPMTIAGTRPLLANPGLMVSVVSDWGWVSIL